MASVNISSANLAALEENCFPLCLSSPKVQELADSVQDQYGCAESNALHCHLNIEYQKVTDGLQGEQKLALSMCVGLWPRVGEFMQSPIFQNSRSKSLLWFDDQSDLWKIGQYLGPDAESWAYAEGPPQFPPIRPWTMTSRVGRCYYPMFLVALVC